MPDIAPTVIRSTPHSLPRVLLVMTAVPNVALPPYSITLSNYTMKQKVND